MRKCRDSYCATACGAQVCRLTHKIFHVTKQMEVSCELYINKQKHKRARSKSRTADYRCLSAGTTSLCSGGLPRTDWPSSSWCCHFSIKSVASRRYFILLLSFPGPRMSGSAWLLPHLAVGRHHRRRTP